jgi:uncharacterized metal-binding protein
MIKKLFLLLIFFCILIVKSKAEARILPYILGKGVELYWHCKKIIEKVPKIPKQIPYLQMSRPSSGSF